MRGRWSRGSSTAIGAGSQPGSRRAHRNQPNPEGGRARNVVRPWSSRLGGDRRLPRMGGVRDLPDPDHHHDQAYGPREDRAVAHSPHTGEDRRRPGDGEDRPAEPRDPPTQRLTPRRADQTVRRRPHGSLPIAPSGRTNINTPVAAHNNTSADATSTPRPPALAPGARVPPTASRRPTVFVGMHPPCRSERAHPQGRPTQPSASTYATDRAHPGRRQDPREARHRPETGPARVNAGGRTREWRTAVGGPRTVGTALCRDRPDTTP